MGTRFQFTDIPSIGEPTIQIGNQSIQSFSDAQLMMIAATLSVLNKEHQNLFGVEMENGGKPASEVIKIITGAIKQRKVVALEREIKVAQDAVAATMTQQQKQEAAQVALADAKAKLEALKAEK